MESESPDGAKLTDEVDAVITFLDDCLQRCSKNVYRYLEDLEQQHQQYSTAKSDDDRMDVDRPSTRGCGSIHVSPLMITVIEQLSAKTRNSTLSPSDFLSLVSFVRKLTMKLLGMQDDFSLVKMVHGKLQSIADGSSICDSFPIMKMAVLRELNAINDLSYHSRSLPRTAGTPGASDTVNSFLDQVEKLTIR